MLLAVTTGPGRFVCLSAPADSLGPWPWPWILIQGVDSQVCEHVPKDTLGNMAASEQIAPVVVSMINTTP